MVVLPLPGIHGVVNLAVDWTLRRIGKQLVARRSTVVFRCQQAARTLGVLTYTLHTVSRIQTRQYYTRNIHYTTSYYTTYIHHTTVPTYCSTHIHTPYYTTCIRL